MVSTKLLSSFIEITPLRGWSPVNLLHIFRTIFYKNTFGELLLLDVLASFIATLLSWLTSLYIKEILIVPFHLKYFLVDTLQFFYTGNYLNFSTQIFNLKWPGWNWSLKTIYNVYIVKKDWEFDIKLHLPNYVFSLKIRT